MHYCLLNLFSVTFNHSTPTKLLQLNQIKPDIKYYTHYITIHNYKYGKHLTAVRLNTDHINYNHWQWAS